MKVGFKMHPKGLTGKEEEAVGQAGHKIACVFMLKSALCHPAVLLCVTGPAHSHRQREADISFAGVGDCKGRTGNGQG